MVIIAPVTGVETHQSKRKTEKKREREREKERWGERGGGGVVDGVNLTATPPTRPGRSPVTGHRVTPVTGAMMTMVHRLPVTVEIKIKSKSKQGHNTNKQEENQLSREKNNRFKGG